MAQNLDPIAPELLLWEERIPGGCHWSGRLRRGTALRIAAPDGRANLAAMFVSARDPLERYNMPDTLKAQHTAMLTRGHALYSDMGRVMASIIADSVGWHDPLGGLLGTAAMVARYGDAPYQTRRNAMHRSGEDGLLIELTKHGLGRADLQPNVNLFSKVVVDDRGRMQFDPDHCKPGAWLDLRADMDLLMVCSAAPHALDPRPDWAPGDVVLTAWRCGPAGPADVCRNACAENRRGFHRSDLLHL